MCQNKSTDNDIKDIKNMVTVVQVWSPAKGVSDLDEDHSLWIINTRNQAIPKSFTCHCLYLADGNLITLNQQLEDSDLIMQLTGSDPLTDGMASKKRYRERMSSLLGKVKRY